MNNYHLFLIRSTGVTQLAAHLVAGILALILVASITAAPRENRSPEAPAVVHLSHAGLPATTPLLATNK